MTVLAGAPPRFFPIALLASVCLSAPALAAGFGDPDGFYGHFDTTLSYGYAARAERRHPTLIGASGGVGSVNSDDGDLNYERGKAISSLVKSTHELDLKRVFYLDEDSWAATIIDQYDARGELWRVAEGHSINLYDKPLHYLTVEPHYDLYSERYAVMGLRNEEPRVYEPIRRSAADFTPARLRELGTR